MLRSLFSGITGLRSHQTMMDVVGNNIANVNTVGYKSQTTVFEDTLSQLLRNGSAPQNGTAGSKFFEGREMTLHASLRQKAREAASRGALGLIIVDDPARV